MNADTDLQVWLETQAQAQHEIIVPYIQSHHSTRLRYLLRTKVKQASGSSTISQGGALEVPADTATPLPKLLLNTINGECRIELILSEKTGPEQRYEFDCSSAKPVAAH